MAQAPRVRLEVWKPKITVVNDSGVIQAASQEPAVWVRCDTIENIGENQQRGNAVEYVEIVDKLYQPRKAYVTLSNTKPNFKAMDNETYVMQFKDGDGSNIQIGGSDATTRLRKNWGPYSNFFKQFQPVRIVDEESHLVLFAGHIYSTKKKLEASTGSTIELTCMDALEILRKVGTGNLVKQAEFASTNTRSQMINYLLNLGVNYHATKPAEADTQGEDAVDTSPDVSPVSTTASFLINSDWTISSASENPYRRYEKSGTTLGEPLKYNLEHTGSANLLTEITRIAIAEPHANETAESAFGYDFFVDPNTSGWYNLSATYGPTAPHFNYFSRGNRLSDVGGAVDCPLYPTTNSSNIPLYSFA